jgi:hypothetical protein
MAITTVDGIIAGAKPPQFLYKSLSSALTAGQVASTFFAGGIPGAAAAPTPGINGAPLTTYAGQIPFTNPSSGQNTYLTRFAVFGYNTSSQANVLLCDRIWHNSGITTNSTSAQNIVTATFPARDNNGTSNGDGYLLGLEVSANCGAQAPTISVSYTNSASSPVAGRTATSQIATTASPVATRFFPLKLEGTDKGVSSIQSITFGGTTWTSGTVHLVVYRILQVAQPSAGAGLSTVSPMQTGLIRLYDNTVPFLLSQYAQNSTLIGTMSVSQG